MYVKCCPYVADADEAAQAAQEVEMARIAVLISEALDHPDELVFLKD